MPFTTSQATSILQSVIKSTTYIGLSTTTPTAAGGNFTEPGSATGYARAQFGPQDASKSAQIANAAIIFFNESLGNGYGTVTHFGLFSSASGGTPFFVGELTPAMSIGSDHVPIFRKQQLVIGLDKAALDSY